MKDEIKSQIKNKKEAQIKDEIEAQIIESIKVCKESIEKNKIKIKKAIEMIIDCYKNKGRVIIFGNGASAADAQHIVAEFVNKMSMDRPMLDAVALTVNTSVLTAIANDSSFEDIYSRQIESFASEKDVIMVLSTSGTSPNIVKGMKKAKELDIPVISLTGESGGIIKDMVDISVDVCSRDVARIQEAHILIGHIICDIVEYELFGETPNSDTIIERINLASQESIKVKEKMKNLLVEKIETAVEMILNTYKNKGRLIAFGNGGSASDAQHIASQLVNKLYLDRPMLDALALNVNTSIITAIGNDSSYNNVFSRQIESLAEEKDVILAISTSGNSQNILNAVELCRKKGIPSIGLTGETGGKMAEIVSLLLNIPSQRTPRIQESHTVIGHIICSLVEEKMFGNKDK